MMLRLRHVFQLLWACGRPYSCRVPFEEYGELGSCTLRKEYTEWANKLRVSLPSTVIRDTQIQLMEAKATAIWVLQVGLRERLTAECFLGPAE